MLSSCKDNNEEVAKGPSASVRLESADMNSASLVLTASGIQQYAYVVYPSTEAPAEAPEATVLFHEGVVSDCKEGDNTITIDGLSPVSDYEFYLAAQTATGYYNEVFHVEFSTTDASEDFTLLSVAPDGYHIYMKMPAEVKERGNVLRYTYSSLPTYNAMKLGWFAQSDVDLLSFNSGQIFGANGETVLDLNVSDDNIYLTDENGELILDEWGYETMLHSPVVPGEPTVFLAGEFTHTEDPDMMEWYGDWFTALFDVDAYYGGGDNGGGDIMWVAPLSVLPTESMELDEDQYWTGYFMRKTWMGKAPEVLDAKLNLEVTDVTALNAKIRITPDEAIQQYSLFIVDDDTYQMTLLPMLNGDENLMQWFATSFYGYQNGSAVYDGPMEINLVDQYYTEAEITYHVFAVGVSDETLQKQCFEKVTFTTLAKTHPAPEVKVTAISAPEGNEASPFEVWFNIKCTTKNAVRGMYAANYIDPWVKENNNYTPNSSLIGMGYQLSDEDVAQTNTDEGLNVMFTTLEGMTTRLGVMLYNDEETSNDPDVDGTTAIADATSGYLADADERSESELFNTLNGDWTLTAQGVAYDWYSGAWGEEPEEIVTKVTISNGVTYPATLSEEVYAAYEGKSTEEVDRLFESFKADADAYNARLRGQNRMLLLGFNSAQEDSKVLSAFEAFYSSEYSCFDNATRLNDFGPKWYLQIDKEGNVTAPFNSARFAPMSNWYYYTMYLAAINEFDDGYMVDYDENGSAVKTMHFPVTVSEDGNTITVKAIEIDGVNYYPNVAYSSWSGTSIMAPKYVSELTLTRGWSGVEAKAVKSNSAAVAKIPANTKFAGKSLQKSRTAFSSTVQYKQNSYRIIRSEEFKENFIKHMKSQKRVAPGK